MFILACDLCRREIRIEEDYYEINIDKIFAPKGKSVSSIKKPENILFKHLCERCVNLTLQSLPFLRRVENDKNSN